MTWFDSCVWGVARECRCSSITPMVRWWAPLNWWDDMSISGLGNLGHGKQHFSKCRLLTMAAKSLGFIPQSCQIRISGNRRKQVGCSANFPGHSHADSSAENRWSRVSNTGSGALGFLRLWLLRCHHLNHRISFLWWSDERLHVAVWRSGKALADAPGLLAEPVGTAVGDKEFSVPAID